MAANAKEGIGRQRKRLSVVSGNSLIDGLAAAAIEDSAGAENEKGSTQTVIAEYNGKSKKGYAPYNPKKANQDSLVMWEDAASNSLLLCVMDGHGEFGDKVSQDLKKNWPPLLFGHPDILTDVPKALTESLNEAEQNMLKKMAGNADFSGTTFVCVIIRGNEMWSGNVGDSRCTAGDRAEDGSFVFRTVTEDQKPDSPGEKERIIAAGGRVFAVQYDDGIDGPQRVWLGNMDIPGLAMARSLGDTIAHSAGVISEPVITYEVLDPEKTAFLVIASDGLWEFMSDQDVISQTAAAVAEGKQLRPIVDELINTSNNLWLKEEEVIDDTTVCVAYLTGYPPADEAAAASS
eukprot:CAMPEP_0205913026 /NCGR_PEP_ID=MMETSP1325-20131115/6240_1 /ASSEMBLY_ACC=CAM_ASM_000708 /TAXON_ID=236786 /ORGANISM="Florenciella sp., Strain RCC1007" /LENGTH=346 /DNA_ID=CAMNT_0053279813 /DNA_START=19 /DNA_END=1059 /DNA_ORIENTATION=-